MKNFLLTLFIFVFSQSITAQLPIIDPLDYSNYFPTYYNESLGVEQYNNISIMNWDSAYTYGNDNLPYTKYYRTYNSFGKPTLEVIYRVMIDSSLQRYRKTEYTYDTQGNLLTLSFSDWQYYNNVWVPSYRLSFSYNSYGKILGKWVESYNNITGALESTERYYLVYNSNNKVIQYIRQYYAQNNIWVNFQKTEFVRDTAGNIIIKNDYEGESVNQWHPVRIDTIVYNSNNQCVKRVSYKNTGGMSTTMIHNISFQRYYDSSGDADYDLLKSYTNNVLNQIWKRYYSYDSTGHVSMALHLDSVNNNVYRNSKRTLFSYDNHGFLIKEQDESYSGYSWIPVIQQFYPRDSLGDLLSYKRIVDPIVYFYSMERFLFSYDSLGRSIRGQHEYYINNNWALYVKEIPIYHNIQETALLPGARYKIFYSTASFTNSINQPVKNMLNVFPNPAHDVLNISFSDNAKAALLTIFDITGKSVINQKIKSDGNYPIDISQLHQGIYILKLHTNSWNYITKIIKQ